MNVYHVAASSVALTLGLLLASLLMAAEGEPAQTSAQMNRPLYHPRAAPAADLSARASVPRTYVPGNTQAYFLTVPSVAQMNRARYRR
ncbi:hypothetical protein [Defluviimonas sp. SAOS-178_SWC]|uniref:hypothetical protein n=1 Tax=Defluviimonas sp. SAOS-178_SWC TaxID=3121287 RepID=UPI003221F603